MSSLTYSVSPVFPMMSSLPIRSLKGSGSQLWPPTGITWEVVNCPYAQATPDYLHQSLWARAQASVAIKAPLGVFRAAKAEAQWTFRSQT